jgi:N-acetylglutamate synthase-like GNAT family acetyltransferase
MPSSTNISVREARVADAGAVIEVVRDSITRLCVADHHNETRLLGDWLENKTTENFGIWLANEDNYCVVAEAPSVCGVGLLHRSGEIRLLYVSPGTQRQGAGRALLERLESQALTWRLSHLHLCSTAVARPFYEASGYRDRCEIETWRGIVCYKYDKSIAL